MCAPNPPPAPDYTQAAVAQGQANKDAAIASARLNNPNVVNPYGTQTFTEGATPEARPTVTQTFSPEQQALYEKNVQAQGLLGDLGVQGAESLQGIVGTPVDYGGAPAAPGGSQETRDKVFNALMQRVNTDTALAKEQAQSDLIARGIRPGTQAYETEFDRINRGYNDARAQAQLASGEEASRDFGMDTEARKNYIAEYLAQRQTPLNEISALLSGSQVTNPFAVPGVSQGANIQPAPFYRAADDQYGASADIYNVDAANRQSLMSGLFGLGGAGILRYSDRRLKSNIRLIGNHPIGVGLYSFTMNGRS